MWRRNSRRRNRFPGSSPDWPGRFWGHLPRMALVPEAQKRGILGRAGHGMGFFHLLCRKDALFGQIICAAKFVQIFRMHRIRHPVWSAPDGKTCGKCDVCCHPKQGKQLICWKICALVRISPGAAVGPVLLRLPVSTWRAWGGHGAGMGLRSDACSPAHATARLAELMFCVCHFSPQDIQMAGQASLASRGRL